MTSIKRICVWSGPRNVSTALMYAFAQRPDTRVIDEPLYAHYLRDSGAEHPGRADVLAAQEQDGERVVRDVVLGPCDRPVLFIKQMAHHLAGLDWSFLERTTNALLVRAPSEMLPSLAKLLSAPTLEDTGLGLQTRLLEHLLDLGQEPVVLDARRVLEDPRGVLARFCERVGLAFDEGMLTWEPGARPEDGVWAPFWYANVHRSTGFAPYRRKNEEVPEHLAQVLAECQTHYDELSAHAL